MKPDLKIRKIKRRFCKETTLFRKIHEANEKDLDEACRNDFKNC